MTPTQFRAGAFALDVDDPDVRHGGSNGFALATRLWSSTKSRRERPATGKPNTPVPASLSTELALRCPAAKIDDALHLAIQDFNHQSAVEDAERPATGLHPVYQDLRRLTITEYRFGENQLELSLGVTWMTRLHRRPWIVTLARLRLHITNHAGSGPHEAKSCVKVNRELPMVTALRSVSKLLRLSVALAILALGFSFFFSTWLLWSLSLITALFILATFFPAYWKMAIRSHALPALDALIAKALREHVHHFDVPEPYRDTTGVSS